ncbi:MAG: DAK2 domain-containing protein, partial [Dehalococcoidia bacterium]
MSTRPDERASAARSAHIAPAAAPATIDGATFRSIFAGAATVLERHVRALNAINVFPVPDGDTGTNMHLTLNAAVEELEQANGDVSKSAHALAHGALMGARGNSGVILSQVLRGLADGLDGRAAADGRALAGALRSASDAAYAALSEPVEGTILTVAREAAEAVRDTPSESAERVLADAVAAAKAAVARTPELLPVLKEAGVVDAGALGLAIILEGLLLSLRGEPLDVDLAPDIPAETGWQREAASLHRAGHGESGYCTEFVVVGEELDLSAARTTLASFGGSLLVVGGDGLLRVHVHTTRPDDALAYGRTLGKISQVKVDNMEAQIDRFAAAQAAEPISADIGIVAVAAGDGIESAFRSVGVTHLVRGGQTMNPSAQEILRAIDACPQERI